MARIPDEGIERLKAEVSLEVWWRRPGWCCAGRGRIRWGAARFIDDREPSLVVSPGKNLWHCLGACQPGGSVIDWVMRTEGMSFRHAVELLRDGQVGTAPSTGRAPSRSSVTRLAPRCNGRRMISGSAPRVGWLVPAS